MREGGANPGGAKVRAKPDRARSANRNEGMTTMQKKPEVNTTKTHTNKGEREEESYPNNEVKGKKDPSQKRTTTNKVEEQGPYKPRRGANPPEKTIQ